jgi:hypothetical protein
VYSFVVEAGANSLSALCAWTTSPVLRSTNRIPSGRAGSGLAGQLVDALVSASSGAGSDDQSEEQE